MNTDRPGAPPLSQQIVAVAWAAQHARDMGKRAHMREAEIDELMRRLEAAKETLETLEFTREVAQ
jgi:phosphoribulokinase